MEIQKVQYGQTSNPKNQPSHFQGTWYLVLTSTHVQSTQKPTDPSRSNPEEHGLTFLAGILCVAGYGAGANNLAIMWVSICFYDQHWIPRNVIWEDIDHASECFGDHPRVEGTFTGELSHIYIYYIHTAHTFGYFWWCKKERKLRNILYLDGKTVVSHGFSAEKTGTRAIRAATVSRLLIVGGGACSGMGRSTFLGWLVWPSTARA